MLNLFGCISPPWQHAVMSGEDNVVSLALEECTRQLDDSVRFSRNNTQIDARWLVQTIDVAIGGV